MYHGIKMRKIDEYLQKRANELNLSRGNALVEIQEQLNYLYPGRVRAKSLKDGELTITTPSAGVAGDLRMRQIAIKKKLEKFEVDKLRINIS